MTEIVAQLFGVIGAIITISSFQFKDNKLYFSAQAAGGLCFAINFYLLGAYTGAVLNLINVARGFGYIAEKKQKPYKTLVGVCILYVAATIFTFDGPLSVIACAAQLIGSFGMFLRNPAKMRIIQLAAVSPMWLIYNVFTFSIGAIVCESANMLSVILFFVRTKLLKGEK